MVISSGERQAQGYRNRRVYVLEFPEGHEYHGVEVRTRSASLGSVLELERLSKLPAEERRAIPLIQVFKPFADALISWNLERKDGTPVPATLDGMLTDDVDLMEALVEAWQEAVAGVSAPKEPKSSDGEQSVEASLPMEVFSESRAI